MDLNLNNHKHYPENISYKIDENSFFVKKKVFFNFWGSFFNFSLLFHIIPFSDHFIFFKPSSNVESKWKAWD